MLRNTPQDVSGSGQIDRFGQTGQDLTDLEFPPARGVEGFTEFVEPFVSFAQNNIVENRHCLAVSVKEFHVEGVVGKLCGVRKQFEFGAAGNELDVDPFPLVGQQRKQPVWQGRTRR